jgi:alpha,alpha-trehalase
METYSAAAACENATVISSIQLSPLLSFLIAVQTAALASLGGGPNFDPKFYVDLPLKYQLNVTTKAFQTLSSSSSQNATIPPSAFQQFQNSYFDEPGSDLLAYTPVDYTPTPANFVPGVQNQQVRKWALQIHALWLILARQTAATVEKQPDQHTLLPVPQPFIIPGDRFREVYYWDSYWIIRGLLVSGMVDTAKGIVESLLALVEQYGFMPNGGRMYYENRSQPPLLSVMILAIFKRVQDPSLLKTALPVLLQEHKFWTTDPHIVLVEDSVCNVHQLSRYWARWDSPRPESSTTDTNVTAGLSTSRQKQVYHDIATAAESGWDFSSRWMQ